MNWKVMIVGILGVLVGLSIAPFEHKNVMASVAPNSANFQIHEATVDESNGQDGRSPVHEAFLLNTQSGEVWRFEGAHYLFDKSKGEAIPVEPKFTRVQVDSGK